MTQEALKLALEALENHTAIKHPQQIHYRDKAITAIKEALAQSEQEPVAWQFMNGSNFRKRKPNDFADLDSDGLPYWKPLYTTPPQRTWVGLTDDEISELSKGHIVRSTYARAIEAKLKEKNA